MLRILLNFCLDIDYKQGGFSNILLKKSFKFISSKRNGIIAFYLSFVLLPVEVNPISKKQNYKKDTLVIHSIGHVEIILVLLIEVVIFYM